MKPRPEGFLAHLYGSSASSQDAEVGDYIAELHAYLWQYLRRTKPWASGRLDRWLPEAPHVPAAVAAHPEAPREGRKASGE